MLDHELCCFDTIQAVWQTDKKTDEQTPHHSIYRAMYIRRAVINSYITATEYIRWFSVMTSCETLVSLLFVSKTVRLGNKSVGELLVCLSRSCGSKKIHKPEFDERRRCDVAESGDATDHVRRARWSGQVPCEALWASTVTVPTGARRVGPRTDTPDDGSRRRRLGLCTESQRNSTDRVCTDELQRWQIFHNYISRTKSDLFDFQYCDI